MKKTISVILLACVMLAGSLFGCYSNTDNDDGKYAGRTKVTFTYYYAGYGDAHYQAMANDFNENISEDVYIKLQPYDDSNSTRAHVIAGTLDADIAQLSVDMFRKQQHLEELSEVYNSNAYGEQTLIKDKDPGKMEYHTEKYKDKDGVEKTGVFQLPSARGGGYNFAYNKDTLNEVFPDGYTLPRTTDEFFQFGKDMFNNGAYLTSAAIADIGGGDYLDYCYQAWFAQLMGSEKYDRFYSGEYYDEATSSWKLNDDRATVGLKVLNDNRQAIEDAYAICYELLPKKNNYLHNASSQLDFLDNDKIIAGKGFKTYRAKTGFLFIGSYLETELEPLVKDGTVEKHEYGMMRVPVASALVKQLEYRNEGALMTDAMLSKIIEAIDNGKDYEQTKVAIGDETLSQKDYNRIYEARKMVVSQICSNIVVPKIKDQSKRNAIMEVLKYMCSDRAQKVSAEATGGICLLPFGKRVSEDELEAEMSTFTKECNAIAEDMITVDYAMVYSLFRANVSLKWYHSSTRLSVYLFDPAANVKVYNPSEMFTATYDYLNGNWDSGMKLYKAAAGIA